MGRMRRGAKGSQPSGRGFRSPAAGGSVALHPSRLGSSFRRKRLARHSREGGTAEAGCRREHSRSEWPVGRATGVAGNPVPLLRLQRRELPLACGERGTFRAGLPLACGERVAHPSSVTPWLVIPAKTLGSSFPRRRESSAFAWAAKRRASTRLRRAGHFEARASARLRRTGYFSLLAQRKVTKRNAPQALRFSGSCPKSTQPRPVFRRLHILVQAAESARSIAPPLQASRPLPPHSNGDPTTARPSAHRRK